MKDMMNYKGYDGSVHYNDGDQIFHGKLEFISALVSYEGEDVKGLKASFEEAVNDYLDMCKEERIEPEKPFKGNFNVRTGSALHRRAALFAKEQNINLNNVIIEALDKYLLARQA
ncbi:type II toxin-antitoxin system HicB family antitoxin [Desulfococcaceae bacterium HSG9]|nr:type II toxin-antitoxin system HicB family antitoxin [Desulfococcaceae bacterium HSG9]